MGLINIIELSKFYMPEGLFIGPYRGYLSLGRRLLLSKRKLIKLIPNNKTLIK